MIKPLVIAHSYLLEKSSTGQILRTFFEFLQREKHFNATILCSKSFHNNVPIQNLKCKVIPTHDNQIVRYLIALAKRIISPDFAFLPDYSYYSWAKISANFKVKKILKDETFDYIHSTSLTCSSHLIALKAKETYGIPWIASFYDPWYDNPYRTFKFSIFKMFDKKLENKIAEKADIILHTNNVILEEWIKRYGESIRHKMYVMPLVFNEPILSVNEIERLNSIRKEEMFTISHIGSLYPGRDSTDFINAFSLFLNRHPEFVGKVKVNYVGTVTIKEKNLISSLKLNGMVNYAGFISESECKKYFLESDLFLAVDGKEARDIFFPSKIMKYFFFGKPIIGLTPKGSVLDTELTKSGNTSFRNDDIEGIANFLYKAISDYSSILHNDKSYWKKYSVESVSKEYLNIVKTIIEPI